MEKKSEHLGFRLTKSDKEYFFDVAEDMELLPGSLAGVIVAKFIKAHKEHGKNMVWPPEFNYRIEAPTAQTKRIQKSKERVES